MHYFGESYAVNAAEVAILDVLMLRGPQTVGELRSRTERLYTFAETGDIEVVLEGLLARPDGALVVKLPRAIGQKESRYAHLLAGEPVFTEVVTPRKEGALSTAERLQSLEDEVASLREQFAALQEKFDEFRRQFE